MEASAAPWARSGVGKLLSSLAPRGRARPEARLTHRQQPGVPGPARPAAAYTPGPGRARPVRSQLPCPSGSAPRLQQRGPDSG